MPANNSYDQFMATIRPGMLGPDGRFLGPNAGVNYQAEGMTPQQFYDFMNQSIEHQSGGGEGGSATYEPRGNADASWQQGPQSSGGLGGMINTPQFWRGLAGFATLGGAGAAGLFGSAAAGGGTAATAGGGALGAASDFGMGTYAAGTGTGAISETAAASLVSQIPEGMTFAEFAATPEGAAAITEANAAAAGTASATTGTGAGLGTYGGGIANESAAETARLAAMNAGTDGLGGISATTGTGLFEGMNFSQLAMKYGPTIAKALLAGGVAGLASNQQHPASGSGGIDSIISGALGNTQSMEHDYNTLFKPWAIDQVGQITARGNEGYDTLMGLSKAPNQNLDAYQQYVDRIGSQGYRDQQRGQAMATVQQQSDMGIDQARRAAMARGVDPSRFALQQNANAMGVAAAKTKAAADAEGMSWDQWGKGAQTASTMRQADGNYRAGLVTGANTLGQAGFNAGAKFIALDGAYRGGLTDSAARLVGAQTGANQVNNAQNNYNDQHSLSGLASSAFADFGGRWLRDSFGSGNTPSTSGGGVSTGTNIFGP